MVSKIIRRFSSAMIAKIITVITSAILTVLLARLLEPDGYGLLFLAISVLSIAKLFSQLGIAKSASTYIAKYKEGEINQIPHILRISFLANAILVFIVSAGLIIGNETIAALIGETKLNNLLLFGSLFVLFGTTLSFNRQILQGFEDIAAASSLSIIDQISRLLFVIGLVVLGYGALGALVGYIIASLVSATIGIVYIYLNRYRVYDSVPRESGIQKSVLMYSVPLSFTHTAHAIDHHFDKVLIGFFVGPVAVAYYTLSKQIVNVTEVPASALGFSLTPTYGSQVAKGELQKARDLYETALSYTILFYIPAAAGMIILAQPGIKIIFGPDYIGAAPVLQVLAIFGFLQAISKITSHGLDYLGRARDRAIIKGLTAVLNLVLNIVLIPVYGALGAAYATVITFYIYTIFNIYIMKTELSFRFRNLIKPVLVTVIISCIIGAIAAILLEYITGVISLFIVIFTGVAVWFVSVIYTGFFDMSIIRQELMDK